ncbi:MAG TPA: substrate-binding domain-containing protein, partial [Rectinemataceae bacterium]
LGVYAAAAELGLRIPRDLAVAGFDGIALGKYSLPPLTTIVQPAREKGRKAASLALDILNGAHPGHHTFDFTLEIRGSTLITGG